MQYRFQIGWPQQRPHIACVAECAVHQEGGLLKRASLDLRCFRHAYGAAFAEETRLFTDPHLRARLLATVNALYLTEPIKIQSKDKQCSSDNRSRAKTIPRISRVHNRVCTSFDHTLSGTGAVNSFSLSHCLCLITMFRTS